MVMYLSTGMVSVPHTLLFGSIKHLSRQGQTDENM